MISTLKERFQKKVVFGEASECWEWIGAKDSYGYGSIRDDAFRGGRRLIASRLQLIWKTGIDDETMVCMHLCNNPSCVNPDHLKWGTYQENMQHMIDSGRAWWQDDNGDPDLRVPKYYGVLDEV